MEALHSQRRLVDSRCCRFDPEKWPIYRGVLLRARQQRIRFAIGGGLAAQAYTGQPRPSKDMDLFITERVRGRMIRVLSDCGFHDYYEQESYDRTWIYRGFKDGAILDVIWAMANHRSEVDSAWIEAGPELDIEDVRIRLVPPEETLWSKLYILQHNRCDWPDALNLLHVVGPEMDWNRLLDRLGSDKRLVGALLSIFAWLCPQRARQLPVWLWREVQAPGPEPDANLECGSRAGLFDTRPWFTPAPPQEPGGKP
jgi:hypothetical protein